MSSSSPGQVFVTGIVILANTRPVDPQKGKRNVAFDVNFPVKDGRKRTLGLLRYFIPEDRADELQKLWEDTFTKAFIIAKIATMPESGVPPELINEDDVCDYAFVGDITEIILTENANVYRNPYLIASGITGECDSANLTFTLTPSQYINLPHTVLDCPISCFIDSESKKWKTKKPMPTTGTNISLSGFLMKIKRDINRKPTFEIELDNIAYLGHPSGTSGSNISNRTTSSITASRTRFNYDCNLPSSSTTMPSPIALGKRKEDEEESSEHDEKRSRTAASD